MPTRAERIGRKRPKKALRALLPESWLEILHEIPADLGMEIAMLVRQLWLLSRSPRRRWHRLFRTSAEHVQERRVEALKAIPPDLRAELRVLMEAGSRHPAEIARACDLLADWAYNSGLPRTAVHFAEAGAAIARNDPHAAFVAGRANRLGGKEWRAEIFYTRAIGDAYRRQQWKDYIRAQLGLGTVLLERGDLPGATERYRSAARVAADQGIEWLAAQTLHDIVGIHFERGDVGAAIETAWNAVSIYPLRNERYPIALHDLAFLYTVQHHHTEVLPLLEALLRIPIPLQDQVLVAGTFARAAGGAGLADHYAQGEARVLHHVHDHGYHADAVFVNLAFGARALGDWLRAERYVRRGIAAAVRKAHPYVERVARALSREIAARAPAPPAAPALPVGRAHQLAALVHTLRAWTPGNQSGPGTLGPV